jgi:hypothetical protein
MNVKNRDLVLGFGVFLGAVVSAGIVAGWGMAGCVRSGLIQTQDTSGECPQCPLDPNRDTVPDCTQANGVDMLPITRFNAFPNTGITQITNDGGTRPLFAAQDLYFYTDGTAMPVFEEKDDTFPHGVQVYAPGFEPAATNGDICDPPDPDNGVLHMFGGPFLSWGGGIGIAMEKLNGRETGNRGYNVESNTMIPLPTTGKLAATNQVDPLAPKGFCCNFEYPALAGCQPTTDPQFAKYVATCPPQNSEFGVLVAALDVSAYEGVSFWARKGPTGQDGIRVMVGDKHTDDDINYLAQRQYGFTGHLDPIYCQRVRECACRNHADCALAIGDQIPDPTDSGAPGALVSMGGDFCGPFPPASHLAQGCAGSNGGPALCCAQTNCNSPYPAFPNDIPDANVNMNTLDWLGADPQYYGRSCSYYAYQNGIGSFWCYNPGSDPPPADPTEQCGDHWESVVTLSTDWTFYKVPFANMHQQGFAKRFDAIDLNAVTVVRFTWDVGYVDYWIDDVSFYRPESQQAP